jgi:hypothetical protein
MASPLIWGKQTTCDATIQLNYSCFRYSQPIVPSQPYI